jgi:hypothetical protein
LVDKHAADNEIETEKRRKPILVRLWLDPTDHPVIMSEEYADRKPESIHQQVGAWFDGFANSPQYEPVPKLKKTRLRALSGAFPPRRRCERPQSHEN